MIKIARVRRTSLVFQRFAQETILNNIHEKIIPKQNHVDVPTRNACEINHLFTQLNDTEKFNTIGACKVFPFLALSFFDIVFLCLIVYL